MILVLLAPLFDAVQMKPFSKYFFHVFGSKMSVFGPKMAVLGAKMAILTSIQKITQ